jgi:propanol-preferring alcohol dehydrogenase
MQGTKLPITASHEGCGTVIAVGRLAQNFQVGHRVLAAIHRNRGLCADCTSTNEQYCELSGGGIGVQVGGAFAEYLLADIRNSCVLLDSIDFVSAAPLACAGITVWRGLLEAKLSKGQTIDIGGSGGSLGHLLIAFAKARGLKVVGGDARDEGLQLSREAGTDTVLDTREGIETVVKKIQNVTRGIGAAATINLSESLLPVWLAE